MMLFQSTMDTTRSCALNLGSYISNTETSLTDRSTSPGLTWHSDTDSYPRHESQLDPGSATGPFARRVPVHAYTSGWNCPGNSLPYLQTERERVSFRCECALLHTASR